jgi:hypothetical protein
MSIDNFHKSCATPTETSVYQLCQQTLLPRPRRYSAPRGPQAMQSWLPQTGGDEGGTPSAQKLELATKGRKTPIENPAALINGLCDGLVTHSCKTH